MNNLTNKLLTKVADLAQTSSVIVHVSDKLLSYLLLQEKASAEKCWTVACSGCLPFIRSKICTLTCCDVGIPPCRQVVRRVPC
jgi:hypothetical protein